MSGKSGKTKDITDLVSQQDVEKAKEVVRKGLKTGLGIGCYNSETDNEIGRSKEHAKHMRRTRRQNFARKMKLIDPHYGKKAAGVLAAGTALGLAATTVPAVGAALGPTVGGAVIAGGLVFLETDAHRAVGDHAILDSLLDDRDDNWRTNTSLQGYDGHGDNISEFDRQQMLLWSDSDSEDDLDNLLPEHMGGSSSKKNELSDSNPLFDAIEQEDNATTNSPLQEDFFSSMESLGLSNNNSTTTKSNVPRPPSPEFVNKGTGQRFTNPHASAELQMMNNTTKNTSSSNTIPDLFAPEPQQPQQDDFFASFTSPSPLTPEVVTPTPSGFSPDVPTNLSLKINENKMRQTNTASQQSNVPQQSFNSQQPTSNTPTDFFANFSSGSDNKSQSFFSSVASAIPSTSQKQTPAQDNSDPFADLYSRPTSSNKPTPTANYNALHGMNKF